MNCWVLVAERVVMRMRTAFFASILRQEVAWFDAKPHGSLNTLLNE